MREYGSNIILPSLDNLFSSEQERQDAKLEKIQILPLSELHPFEGHPFQRFAHGAADARDLRGKAGLHAHDL